MNPWSRRSAKALTRTISVVAMWPLAALSGWGRFEPAFTFFAHATALLPGLMGDYLRVAYYHLTLRRCALDSRISFGTFFAHPSAEVGSGVYLGAYCVIGMCRIGDRTQIASHVQILSGRTQHIRDEAGHLTGSEGGYFTKIEIGCDCWIGASAIIMANVGDGATLGAGSVVVSGIPACVVAVGNPARVLSPAPR